MKSLNKEIKLSKNLLRKAGRAIYDYNMIQNKDRVLLAVSGGKDSLSLFHILQHFQKHAPIQFDFAVVSIDPEVDGFDLSVLIPYFKQFNVPYFVEKYPIFTQAEKSMHGDSYCSFCARLKRGLMYKVARKNNYNVLALGQHLDDLAESLMMSVFHNGHLKTMKANYINDNGDVRVIRPLIYVRERQLQANAQRNNLPVVLENCPACVKKPTERQYFKTFLTNEEKRNKNLYNNILHSMRPILT